MNEEFDKAIHYAISEVSELERNWLIQVGVLTHAQVDAITPGDVMRAYRMGCRGIEKANDQAENFERLYYLMLYELERLLESSEALSNYAWSAVTVDCNEARKYLNTLIDGLRLEVATIRKALSGTKLSRTSDTRKLGADALAGATGALTGPQERAADEGAQTISSALLDRIERALERHLYEHAPRRIPADQTDSDIVLFDLRAART